VRRDDRAHGAAAGVVLVGGFGVGSQAIGARAASITQVTVSPDPSVNDRFTLWAAALSMWREHPVAGAGLKRFPAERDGHAGLRLSSASGTGGAGQGFAREPLLSPHNMYLLVLGEQGLVGCSLLAGGWAAVLALGLRRLRGSPPAAHGAGLCAVGLLLWQCVDFAYADIGGPSTVLTALLLGLAAWWALHTPAGGAG
jgi:O-antigen ligase